MENRKLKLKDNKKAYTGLSDTGFWYLTQSIALLTKSAKSFDVTLTL
ncbi:hypothetical protein SAMN04488514_101598 [Kriegella aquimaris]|uniref:Uncharacterized protein n=1 Tax=Kriegella aquimaris TaxID=192904 RepID=A0A1G9JKT3_9FLAO|nr:hypothetical protein SAMN04488514_101598 [Kriegella aquimaris]